VVLETEICDDDEVLARARVVTVFVDGATGRPAEPRPAYRETLLRVVGSAR